MNRIDKDILIKAESYVTKLFEDKLPSGYHFHTLDHTRYVATGCDIIGQQTSLSEEELNIVSCAAWFHDTGYVFGHEDHEEESMKFAQVFLREQHVDEDSIKLVEECIRATRIPQTPGTLMAKVLCDADMRHLADDDYFEFADKMRQEWSSTRGKKYGKRKFHSTSLKFLQKHQYFTEYGMNVLSVAKEKTIDKLNKEIYILEQKKENKIMEEVKKKSRKKTYSRGVESMFRLTARNQISLSSIADNKSNILITVNTLILSIALTVLISRFDEAPNIILPTLIFITFSLITIIFAILSTRPNISSGRFTKADIKEKKVNLIFFGNFYNMDLDEYEWAIEEMIKDDDYLYSTMIKDQYSLGKVLAKKYKLLRMAYTIFMVGIIISVASFILAFMNI